MSVPEFELFMVWSPEQGLLHEMAAGSLCGREQLMCWTARQGLPGTTLKYRGPPANSCLQGTCVHSKQVQHPGVL